MPDMEDLMKILMASLGNNSNNSENKEENNSKEDENNIFGDIDMDMLFKLMEMFENLNKNDKNSELLLALKPHLRTENQGKVDQAMQMMKLMSILPMLKGNGLF